MIYLFTGDGKGKTTASIGQAVRALGQGKKVLIIEFIKGQWLSGEDLFFEKFKIPKKKIQIIKSGQGFVGIFNDKLPFHQHISSAQKGIQLTKKALLEKNYDLVILDEINLAEYLGLVKLSQIKELIELAKKNQIDLILTGRNANKKIYHYCDLITEMRKIKHPFDQGEIGQPGREW